MMPRTFKMLFKFLLWGFLLLVVLAVLGIAALLFYGWTQASHYNSLTDTHDLPRRIDEMATPYAAKRHNVRLVIGVSQRGKRYVKEFGDVPEQRADAPSPIYEIGSVTKVFTGILLAHMAEQGTVRLDQPISELVPDQVKLPAPVQSVTLRQLATHTAGFPRLPSNLAVSSDDPYAKYSAEQMYADLSQLELDSEPGTSSDYSNYSMGLLGHLLALKAGKSYSDLIQETICQPLGMSSTALDLNEQQQARFVPGHSPNGKEHQPWGFDVLAGAGGLRSDVHDMLTFLEANLHPPEDELGRALKKAQEVHHARGFDQVGLAWQIQDDPYLNVRMHWHNGGTAGFVSFVGLVRSHDLAVAILANYGDAFARDSSVDNMGVRILRYGTKISLD